MLLKEIRRHILQSRPGPGPGSGPSQKAGPGPLEKADPIPNPLYKLKTQF